MSLFKLINLWSFTLNQLEELIRQEESTSTGEESPRQANFTVCPGNFKSIGVENVALVCGSLSGLLCIIQVPEDQQQTTQSPPGSGTRQLLAAKKLQQPVIDLKCGFFSSAVKQSIAVLGLSELTIYQVKKNQPNLLSGSTSDQQYSLLDDDLFSHRLEEVYKFTLLANEITACLQVSPQDSCVRRTEENTLEARESLSHSSSKLSLPQRDFIVVQYTNQFIFTLINHKKIIAHFQVLYPSSKTNNPNINSSHVNQVQHLSCSLGGQAMTLMHNSTSECLAMALSNNYLYNFSVNKLIGFSKDNVMKRVVNSLLSSETRGQRMNEQHSSSLVYNRNSDDNASTAIQLDLNHHSEWRIELPYAALEMQSVSLNNPSISQLIVLSRYYVDVFSNSSQHLWSYRSETPLICMHCYSSSQTTTSKQSKLVTLLCSDSINEERCNLLVLEDGSKVWSSLMYQKPSHIWRTNLTHIQGAIASLGVRDSCVSFGYLGTNSGDSSDYSDEDYKEINFNQLESLTESPFDQTQSKKNTKSYPHLLFDITLQASNKWPEVRVDTKINIKPDSKSHGILQNVVIYLEYDDMLNFIPDAVTMAKSTPINEGAIQVELGTFWADGDEALSMSGTFSLKPVISIESKHAFPKTIEVKLSIRFLLHQKETLIQNDRFLLPLTIMANLTHIEHQLLDATESSSYELLESTSHDNSKYTSIITSEDEVELVGLTDILIESDLVCRGFNSESRKNQLRMSKIKSENYATTIENLTLLSQSLDCRLRYKSLGSCTPIPRQESENYSPLVAVKMAFEFEKMFMFPDVMMDLEPVENYSNQLRVWLHLYNISAGDNCQSIREVVKEHLRSVEGGEKMFESLVNKKESKVIIAIESHHPLALMTVQQHLLNRLNSNNYQMKAVHESNLMKDSIKTNEIKNMEKSQVLVNPSLSEFLNNVNQKYNLELRKKFEDMKDELKIGFYKFQLTSMAIVSYSKRLPDLPDDATNHLESLVSLNRKYQLHLLEVLSKLELLTELDKQYSKIPDSQFFKYRTGCEVQLSEN